MHCRTGFHLAAMRAKLTGKGKGRHPYQTNGCDASCEKTVDLNDVESCDILIKDLENMDSQRRLQRS